jgi:hypothetical protein
MKINIKRCLFLLFLLNTLINAKTHLEKFNETFENRITYKANERRNKKLTTKNSLSSKLLTKYKSNSKLHSKTPNLVEQAKLLGDSILGYSQNNQPTVKPTKLQYITTALSFALEIVAQMEIPIISEMARNALKFKQWGQACIDGIKFFLPFIIGDNKNDPDYVSEKAKVENEYQEYLKTVRETHILFFDQGKEFEEVLNNENVKEICLKIKEKQFLEVDSTTVKFVKDVMKYEIESFKKNFILDDNPIDFYDIFCRTVKAPFFGRYLCYKYINLEYFKLTKAEKLVKSKQIVFEISKNFDLLYTQSLEELKKYKEIIEQLNCDLAPEPYQTSKLSMILSFIKKFIDALKAGKSFVQDCINPAYELAAEVVEEKIQKRREKIETETLRAEEFAMKYPTNPEKIIEAITQAMSNQESDPNEVLNVNAAKEELEVFEKNAQDSEQSNSDIEQIMRSVNFNDDYLAEDIHFDEAKDNPSSAAKQMEGKIRGTVRKVADIAKYVGSSFIEEAKKKAKKMMEFEIKDFLKNPLKYQAKVCSEAAKFALNPKKYISQTVIEFGVRTTTNTALNLAEETKKDVLTEKYREVHPERAYLIDSAFDVAKKNKKKMKEEGIKYIQNKTGMHRFKEILSRRSKRRSNISLMTTKNPIAIRVQKYLQNRIRGILSNNLSLLFQEKGLSDFKQFALDIKNKFASKFLTFVKNNLCLNLSNLIMDFFGLGGLRIIYRARQMYDVLKDYYNAYNETDIVKKWTLYGGSIGKIIKFLKDVNPLLCSKKKLKKFYKR